LKGGVIPPYWGEGGEGATNSPKKKKKKGGKRGGGCTFLNHINNIKKSHQYMEPTWRSIGRWERIVFGKKGKKGHFVLLSLPRPERGGRKKLAICNLRGRGLKNSTRGKRKKRDPSNGLGARVVCPG